MECPSHASTHWDGGSGLSFGKSITSAILVFAVIWLILFACRLDTWPLNGADAYYHLRCANYLAEQGLTTTTLPWTRLSIFEELWADKEYLFHIFLIPFADHQDLVAGGKLALTTINALEFALVLFLGLRWFGPAGILVPLGMLGASLHLWFRLDLLRPHNFSLLILLLSAYQIYKRRHKTLTVLAACYSLCYIAWHTLLILCVGTFVLLWWTQHTREWRLIAYPAIGLMIGLLLHPAFPGNLVIWKLNNVDFYHYASELNLGIEIEPLTAKELGLSNFAGIALLVAGWMAYRPRISDLLTNRRTIVLGGFCVAFLFLYAFAARFVEYAAPFATLFAFSLFHTCHTRLGSSELARQRRVIFFSVFIPMTVLFHAYLFTHISWPNRDRTYFRSLTSAETFSDSLPSKAKVAAPWDATGYYMAAAPQAFYLNALDPVFMLARDPTLPRIAADFFAGQQPDPVHILRERLASDYVAAGQQHRELKNQLMADPRLAILYDGPNHFVFGIAQTNIQSISPGPYRSH